MIKRFWDFVTKHKLAFIFYVLINPILAYLLLIATSTPINPVWVFVFLYFGGYISIGFCVYSMWFWVTVNRSIRKEKAFIAKLRDFLSAVNSNDYSEYCFPIPPEFWYRNMIFRLLKICRDGGRLVIPESDRSAENKSYYLRMRRQRLDENDKFTNDGGYRKVNELFYQPGHPPGVYEIVLVPRNSDLKFLDALQREVKERRPNICLFFDKEAGDVLKSIK